MTLDMPPDLGSTNAFSSSFQRLWCRWPLEPGKARVVTTLPGTGWGDFSFSFDDRRVAMVEFKSVEDSRVHILDLATGKRTQVLPRPGDPARMTSSDLAFASDRRYLFLATDLGGEFRRAARLALYNGKLRFFGPENADVEQWVGFEVGAN